MWGPGHSRAPTTRPARINADGWGLRHWLAAGARCGVRGLAARAGARTAPQPRPMPAVPLTSSAGQVRFPTLSPDGDHVAFTWTDRSRTTQDVYVQQIGAGSPLRLTTDPGRRLQPCLVARRPRDRVPSPPSELRDSRTAVGAAAWRPGAKIADIRTGNPLYRPLTIAWCPDSSCVLVVPTAGRGQGRCAVRVRSRRGATSRQLTFPPAGVIDNDPAISPDGRSLVFRRDFTPFTGDMYRLALRPDMTPARGTDAPHRQGPARRGRRGCRTAATSCSRQSGACGDSMRSVAARRRDCRSSGWTAFSRRSPD